MKNVHYGLFLFLLGCPDEDKFAPMVEIVDMGIAADAEQRNNASDANTASDANADSDANTESTTDLGQEVDAGEQDAAVFNDMFEEENDATTSPESDACVESVPADSEAVTDGQCVVIFEVIVPETTTNDVFLAGDFCVANCEVTDNETCCDESSGCCNWVTDDPTLMGSEALCTENQKHFVVSLLANQTYAYKYTLGSWDTVELNEQFGDVANRLVTPFCDDGAPYIVRDVVDTWPGSQP